MTELEQLLLQQLKALSAQHANQSQLFAAQVKQLAKRLNEQSEAIEALSTQVKALALELRS